MIPDRALVIGLGSTGISCSRFLNGRTELYVTDTRVGHDEPIKQRLSELEADCDAAKFIEPRDVASIVDKDTVVYASPGIALHDPIFDSIRAAGSRISCDVELFCDLVDAPLVGVTGTNGKTTTTDLVARMLRAKGFLSGGNIGIPVLDLLESQASGYVLELSSFQLEKIKPPSLTSATILNITEDHLDHHRTFLKYVASKHRIYEQCEVAVFNADDPLTKPMRENGSVIPVNGTNDWCVRSNEVVIGTEVVPVDELQLKGAQNHLDIVIAAALAHVCGAGIPDLVEVATAYEGLPHRMQLIAEFEGVRYVNDSKATNVAATCAALESWSNGHPNILLLAGGDGKGATFEPLANPLRDHVKTAILFGRDAMMIEAAVGEATECAYSDSLERAVHQARELAQPGDVVLLSPACASFDMFTDYIQRGNQFTSIVKAIVS